ncbi:MAG: YebC/PmpR family DNA-binding transcriptional regulator [Clostridia bacterium]|nr:MAG: YebC/PmpR family DNA-binding transcriptional regulator [Clostridia bacterium]
MSGHSKWANIKHRKTKVDAQRGKLFTRLGRELIVAAREGGPDPESNARLKAAMQRAREANMPNENIMRAIQRGTGELGGADYEELTYEGYGPGGIAVMLSLVTDNRNRTASEIRYLFSRYGGSLGEAGCVAWMFDSKGQIMVDISGDAADEVMLAAIEAGAEDVNNQGDMVEVTTAPDQLTQVSEGLKQAGFKIEQAQVTMLPQATVPITDAEQAQKLLRLMEALEEHDDVQEIYSNFDLPDEILEQLQEG